MDIQEIFNKAVSGMINQGSPSSDEDGTCLYRSEGGKKCAVGFLISDEHYTGEHGILTVPQSRMMVEDSIGRPLEEIELNMLRRLQVAHDDLVLTGSPNFLEGFTANARQVAEEYNLTMPEGSQ